jgi:large subunit ribosomal protein L18
MNRTTLKIAKRVRRKAGIRKRVTGSPDRPRLTVFRSARHIYAQVIDDLAGRTIASASTVGKSAAVAQPQSPPEAPGNPGAPGTPGAPGASGAAEGAPEAPAGKPGAKKGGKKDVAPKVSGGKKTWSASAVGKALAERARSAGVVEVVFDRNGYRFHGRIKALANAAREGGLKF